MTSIRKSAIIVGALFLISYCLSIRKSIDPNAWNRQGEFRIVQTERSYEIYTLKERTPQKTDTVF